MSMVLMSNQTSVSRTHQSLSSIISPSLCQPVVVLVVVRGGLATLRALGFTLFTGLSPSIPPSLLSHFPSLPLILLLHLSHLFCAIMADDDEDIVACCATVKLLYCNSAYALCGKPKRKQTVMKR